MPCSIAAWRSDAHLDPVLPVGRDAAHDLGADRGGLLAARIVVGHQREVGEARGDLAHHRPLAAVAVAAAAEHHDQLALGERPQGRQHRLQRLGLVGVVDIDRRAASCGGPRAAAGPARRSGSPAPRRARATSPPVATTRPSAASAFEAWKPPTSGSSTSWRRAQHLDDQMLAARRRLVAQQPQLAALGAVGPEAHAAARADFAELRRAVAVGVHDGRAAWPAAAPRTGAPWRRNTHPSSGDSRDARASGW